MKKAMRDNFPLLLFVVTALTETGGKASVSEDVQSITMGGSSKDKASLYSTTQDTERRAPAVTTAPPLPIINHHPLYRNPPYYTPSLGLNGQPSYEDSGGSTHPTSATLLSGTSLDNAHRMPPDQMDEDSSITPNPDTHSLSSHFNTAVPASKMLPRDPDGGAIGRFITKEKDTEMPNSAGLKLNVRPGSETTTAAIITTMQSPVPCQFNLTGPEGYIEAPPQSSAAFFSTVDCSYTITAYMGYGVEVQVMNVNLSAGDKVVLEDMGYGENTMLANESILMRGLVVRSHSNQISIRLHSPRALAASVLLRYQC